MLTTFEDIWVYRVVQGIFDLAQTQLLNSENEQPPKEENFKAKLPYHEGVQNIEDAHKVLHSMSKKWANVGHSKVQVDTLYNYLTEQH